MIYTILWEESSFFPENFVQNFQSQAKISKLRISYKKVSPGEKNFSHRKLKNLTKKD
jgi:hypothetical protein